MRRIACLLLCASAAVVAGQSAEHAQDDSQIRSLVASYMDARNTRDATATERLFTADADQLVSTGEWRKGSAALVKGAMASSHKEAAKSSISIESIRFLNPEVAIVDGRYETVSAVTGAARKMWTTLIVTRTDNDWRITAIRNMLPAPPAGR